MVRSVFVPAKAVQLKLAIDNALLPAFSSSLLSSYLQVLIMSEGDNWLHKAVYEISLLIRDPHSSPVKAAEQMVRQFCTKELRGVQGGVNGVEEYIANAALDLVIMAVWSVAAGQMGVDGLPVSGRGRGEADGRRIPLLEICGRGRCSPSPWRRTRLGYQRRIGE